MSCFLTFVMVIFLVVVVMLVLCATALLLGTLLGLLFPVTAFQEALLSTLFAIGAVLAFLLADLGKVREMISRSLESPQEEKDFSFPRHYPIFWL